MSRFFLSKITFRHTPSAFAHQIINSSPTNIYGGAWKLSFGFCHCERLFLHHLPQESHKWYKMRRWAIQWVKYWLLTGILRSMGLGRGIIWSFLPSFTPVRNSCKLHAHESELLRYGQRNSISFLPDKKILKARVDNIPAASLRSRQVGEEVPPNWRGSPMSSYCYS